MGINSWLVLTSNHSVLVTYVLITVVESPIPKSGIREPFRHDSRLASHCNHMDVLKKMLMWKAQMSWLDVWGIEMTEDADKGLV